jgi:hypothetical protein
VWVGDHPEDIKKVQYASFEYETALSIVEYLLERNLDKTPQMEYWINYANEKRVLQEQAMLDFKTKILDPLNLKPYTKWSVEYATGNITCY